MGKRRIIFNMPKMELGPYIRHIRKSRGNRGSWSIRAVALRAGISNSYLSQVETGQVKQPLPDVLKKLAQALDVPYLDLMKAAGYLPEGFQSQEEVSFEIIEALKDPIAKRTLLEIHRAPENIKEVLGQICNNISQLPIKKISAIEVIIEGLIKANHKE